ncbi:CLUMA_CG013520, isoform A [Clunio marinus]|uniref:CLUMA_CG013520, isoform A n=1 Tax=Clunio marinus TaxID=568069 RepID=A0A1J1IJ25_9DIPT|nr:CLUMA_CG013520, isoform A [Clunio marinus]
MFPSGKIAIPNNTKINCLSWEKNQGYIAIGGDDGMLKVLKLEQAAVSSTQQKSGLAAPSNLSMNQTLEGHKASIQVVVWNETQQKLTTSDFDGVIMVWMMYKGSFFEEMTNDRKKSTVKGMAWTSDGQKICIVYEDGAVIVGSVDGNRLWGKELKNTSLSAVQWSPDNRLLLFAIRNGEVHLYDNTGIFISKLNIQCVTLSASKSVSVVGLCWFHGIVQGNRPALAICYETGKIQLMKNESDETPTIIDANIQITAAQWNESGRILGVCGMKNSLNEKENNHVMFFSSFGQHLRTLKIPGREITSLSWEGKSNCRIALGVDSFIYFANIRLDYLWCYFNKTVAFIETSNQSHQIIDPNQNVVVFWDTQGNSKVTKVVDYVLSIQACGDHCAIASETQNINPKDSNILIETNFKDQMYQINICNSLGTTVDSKYVDLKPQFLAMNLTHVIIASQSQFLCWQYHTPKSTLHGLKQKKDKRFHIDDNPSGVNEVLSDLDRGVTYDPPVKNIPTKDSICCIAASDKILLIGRESGIIQEYVLPTVAICNRHSFVNRACKISINCNSTRAAIVDSTGLMTTIDLNDYSGKSSSEKFERKDVWSVCWAKDNPQLLAIMEKTRMYIFKGADPEEPISSSGYICSFDDLEITAVLLDEIVTGTTPPNTSDHLLHLRVKSLRDTEDLLQHVGLAEAKQFIEDNSHPRLWRLLGESSLKKLDMETAESAFVRCTNYQGIQFIKKLRTIQNENIQKAEVAAFFGDFDEAEKLYIDADRRDLAIDLRSTLCDWFRVIQLYRMASGISDQQMEIAYREIGNHFASMRVWESAREYYEKAHHIEGLMETFYHLEKYDELENLITRLPEKSPLLSRLGQMLATVGMTEKAVEAFKKCGDVKSAVSTCVSLSQWGLAVELAQKYKMPSVNALLNKHAAHLLQEGKLPEAVELQKKAGRYLDASRLLIKLAEREVEKKSPHLRIKQLYILAGLLAEDHLQTQASVTGGNRATVLAQLTAEDGILIENIWHHAEAYHFILLAQRQLLAGLMHSAVLSSLRLRDYEDVLNVEKIYSLIALASCADRSFGTCSKAFIKLEALDSIPEAKRQEYEELAVSILSRYEPKDAKIDQNSCFACETMVADWQTSCPNCGSHFPGCIASGQSIMNPQLAWQCNKCQHLAKRIEIAIRKSCPLCHSVVNLQRTEI